MTSGQIMRILLRTVWAQSVWRGIHHDIHVIPYPALIGKGRPLLTHEQAPKHRLLCKLQAVYPNLLSPAGSSHVTFEWEFCWNASPPGGVGGRSTCPSDWGYSGVTPVFSMSNNLQTSTNTFDSKLVPWSLWSWLGTPERQINSFTIASQQQWWPPGLVLGNQSQSI